MLRCGRGRAGAGEILASVSETAGAGSRDIKKQGTSQDLMPVVTTEGFLCQGLGCGGGEVRGDTRKYSRDIRRRFSDCLNQRERVARWDASGS